MILVKPSFKILKQYDIDSSIDVLRTLERAGRVCYKSERKITNDSCSQFVKGIISRGHESVLEHQSISVSVVCDRGVSHEIVRHRIASYSQESTRYCNYSGGVTFVIPPWINMSPGDIDKHEIVYYAKSEMWNEYAWLRSCHFAEQQYLTLLKNGWTPQQARTVLTNSLKTELVWTMNLREWRHFFRLRTASAAHPQMRELAIPMLAEFKGIIPFVFDDLTVE